ncbi:MULTISPECIES: response regulator transcription factor [Desulfitobacterium]|uniref:Stage 0 sporulation protein A homolog n=1 Tax=Desulfitobacterium dehalogenans (strain ATCC 51507 / DSM 9161 / JW/IU-DC1) TaxID=756499 RepID=I4A4S1_DESDJ|nr:MULTISPECIES: response regulator transcription factor [Desulfitobacterium]AFL98955.1 response regulator with CheY-like receiver domain and winged-helix DNA-binding domain [Desulfitobacterium dehalogenans ATCC 51507]
MSKILIIEDDPIIRVELKSLLEKHGYEVAAPDAFEDMVNTALNAAPHLILLDLNLPFYDGHHIGREIRKQSSVPLIVVTSRSTETDELLSMHLGADDFITKPYNVQILLARIENVLRRVYGHQNELILQAAGLTLNLGESTVSFHGQTRELTKNELKIMTLLMKSQGKILPREQIMTELWQTDEFVDDNTLTVNINRLRKTLGEIGAVDVIQTKRGQGYRICN